MFLSLQVHFHSAHTLSSTRASPTRTQVIPAVLCPVLRIQRTSYSSAAHCHVRCGFSLGMLRQRFSNTDASISTVCAFLLVVPFFLLSSVQKQQAFKSRVLALRLRLSRADNAHSLSKLPLAHDTFRRLHRPNPLSADTAVAGLHSAARTWALCKAKMERVMLPAKRRKHWCKSCWVSCITMSPGGGPKWGETPSFSLNKGWVNICWPPQEYGCILSWWTSM